MKKVTTFSAALGLLALGTSAFAQFTGGNLVVSVVKSNTTGVALNNSASRHTLREYTILGVPTATPDVNIYGLASEVSGSNRRATVSGTATSEGFLTLTPDNQYIVFVGYDADLGTQGPLSGTPPAPTSIVNTTSANVNRVIGRYQWNQAPSATSLNTSTFITDAFSANNIRSAASLDGTQFWAAGANSGIRYTDSTLTVGTTLQVSGGTVVNWRVTKIYNGQLYATSASGTATGLNTIGTGTPSAASQTVTRLINTANSSLGVNSTGTSTTSPYDFIFTDANTVYIADDTAGTANLANGGLQKWTTTDGTNWTNTATVVIPGASTARVGLRGLAKGAGNLFYATTTDKRLISIDVTDINNPVVVALATAPIDEEWRDVEVLPVIRTNFTVSGTISFQSGLESVPKNQSLFLTFTPSVGTPITQTVTPDSNGNYTSQPVPPGTYRLKVKTTYSLSEAANVTVTTSNVTGQNFTLRGGDITSDNAVDINDLLALIGAYNQVSPAAGYSAAADVNNDGKDDISDLLIIIGNYNQVGNN